MTAGDLTKVGGHKPPLLRNQGFTSLTSRNALVFLTNCLKPPFLYADTKKEQEDSCNADGVPEVKGPFT
jgi:hypothetical protein